MLKRLMFASSVLCLTATGALAGNPTTIQIPPSCANVSPGSPQANNLNTALKTALTAAVNPPNGGQNGGLGFNMWATVVANDGTVCAVAFTGANYKQQWLASRVISAQKAATANSLSLGATTGSPNPGKLALSSANLYSATRDGGSLFGLQFSNPVDPASAYLDSNGSQPDPTTFGTGSDPMIGRPIGGINVFGGGLAAFADNAAKVGGIGVSGDTSCTDHMVAWRLRRKSGLDYLASAGVSGPAALFAGDNGHPDNIIFDIPANATSLVGNNGLSASGFGHPTCLNNPPIDPNTKTAAGGLSPVE